ncbi:Phytocyanin domain-containing protein [Forsythia ovata]|uniref:Phytocyanin domain-containing protein n=1 Tax=Forsythia ovata TaxID=205694 RepID=A0ABD1T3K1_9LAMI
MSFIKASSVFLLMISALFGASMAAVYQVGDSDGWNAFGTDYKKWAATKNFQVGDSIAGQKVSTPVGNSVSTGSGQNLPPPHLPQYDPTMTYGGSCPLSSGKLGLLIMVGSLLLAFQLH